MEDQNLMETTEEATEMVEIDVGGVPTWAKVGGGIIAAAVGAWLIKRRLDKKKIEEAAKRFEEAERVGDV